MRAAAASMIMLAGCGQEVDPYASVRPIIAEHCTPCHSSRPTHPGYDAPPVGVVFDRPAEVKKLAARIRMVAVTTDIMPLGNETTMTQAERDTLGRWIEVGAPTGKNQ